MDKKIQEIREALEAATPGDWQEEGMEIWKRGKEYQCGDRHVHICDVVNDDNRKFIANAPSYVDYLLQQIEIKNKALKWYAAIENYKIGNFTVDQNGELDEWESRVQQDAGEKARTALKGEDTP
ncbi:ead/Ea22-like family protein [Paenibacillus sp. BJ-4]|uniref:ead/Ea22-like family protein n=1 Tax=Paenibacillus sp. BJ-4 TaxID=2878097 RepID=UPI001CF0C17B|nr:ead/Ea22-like family protein [Paenibacillus sp. BJ-4]